MKQLLTVLLLSSAFTFGVGCAHKKKCCGGDKKQCELKKDKKDCKDKKSCDMKEKKKCCSKDKKKS